jgi:peptidoglycan/LPS O-acetylase OafA/YrhL
MTTTDAPPEADLGHQPRLGHQPGLDGLRGLMLLPVLLFHSGFMFVQGAMFGLSTFFTLSGYLITTLLIEERRTHGTIGLGNFWRRRFRRLLPASLLAMILAIAFAVFAGDATQRAEVGGDVVASLGYVANWWFLVSGQSYFDLFTGPSPLLHIWSLAVEEQFYMVLPLVAWGLLRRRNLMWFAIVIAIAMVVTTSLPLVFNLSDDWIYYSTPTRLPEMLAGVLLAVVLATGNRRSLLTRPGSTVPTAVAGAAALAVMLWLWHNVGLDTPWVYRGGFAAFSLVSIVLIMSVHNRSSPVTRAITIAPLLYLGRISYGVYLFHWPLFLWINPQNTGLDPWPLFAVRMMVVLALAIASFHLIEDPIRRTGRLSIAGVLRPMGRVAPIAIAAIIAIGLLASATAPPPAGDLAAAERSLDDTGWTFTTPATPLLTTDSTDPAAIYAALPDVRTSLRMASFGDSTGLMTGIGLGNWAETQPDLTAVPGAGLIGCGLSLGGDRLFAAGRIEPTSEQCAAWPALWRNQARSHAPDIGVVQVGLWDILPRQFEPDGPFRIPGDPVFDATVLAEMVAAVDLLNAEGTYVVWTTAPPPNAGLDAGTHFAGPESLETARFARLNQLVAELPTLRPGGVSVVDTSSWVTARPDDATLRPDGIHLTDEGATTVATDYLGPEAMGIYQQAWADGSARQVMANAIAARNTLPALRAIDPADPTVRILVYTDERAPEIAALLEQWQRRTGTAADIAVVAPPQCGIAATHQRRNEEGTITTDDTCRQRTAFTSALTDHQPHIVILAPGAWENAEHKPFADSTTWEQPSDFIGALWIQDRFGTAADEARATGARVVMASVNDASLPWRTRTDVVLDRSAAINVSMGTISNALARLAWVTMIDPANQPALDAALRPIP